MIELDAVSKVLPSAGRPLTILHPLHLSVPQGQLLAVMGPSGSGKSTLLGLIAGLDNPSGGSIRINGASLGDMNEDALARFRAHTIGIVFQTFQLIPTLTALENVMVPLELLRVHGPAQQAKELLAQVGLAERMTHYPAQLSGGEQQRVAVARAFAGQPAVLLADEPTGNLDGRNGALVLELLHKLHQARGTTIVLVTHDPEVAEQAQRIVRLRDGRIEADSHAPMQPLSATGNIATTVGDASPTASTHTAPLES